MAILNLKHSNLLGIIGTLALVFGLPACSDDDAPGNPGAGASGGSAGSGGSGGSAGTGSVARVRLVHAAPEAPAVDVYPQGSSSALVENLAYGKSSDYLELPPGTYQVDVRAAGSDSSSLPAFTSGDISVAAGQTYTAVAAGKLGSTDAGDQFRVLALEEGFEAASSGNARVRVVHAGVDAPSVDLDLGNDDPAQPELSGLDRFADSGAAGVELPAGQALQVGIAAGGSTVTAFTTPALPDGGDLFVIATGELSKLAREDEGFSLLAVLPGGSDTLWLRQNPVVYALHASPDAGGVDVYIGDDEVFDNIVYGDLGRIQAPPGSYDLDFFPGATGATPRPSGAAAATAKTPNLDAGQSYLAIAAGQLTAKPSSFQLIPLAEGFALDDTGARVRVVHASGNAPSVDIGPVSAPGNIDALPAASLTVGVAAAGTTATVAEFPLTLGARQRAFAVAAGNLGGTPNPFGLLVVDTTQRPWTAVGVANTK